MADAELTRQLSQFLRAAGYPTCEAADEQTAMAAMESGVRRAVVVDATLAALNDWSLCRMLAGRAAIDRPFLILLMPSADEAQARAALEAGVDDILLLPVCYGEMLSRLHVAARVLEHDRRVSRQEPFDPITGLWSRSAFVGQLRQQWSAASEKSESLACVVIDLDLIRAVRHSEGVGGVRALVAAVIAELNQLCGKTGVLACLGGDRFGVMLPGETTEVAAQWGENVRRALSERTFVSCGEARHRLTASVGVSGRESADSGEQLLKQAVAALEVAKSTGRNRVVRWGEFATDPDSTSMQSRILERTRAWHVMIPCPVFLQADDSLNYAAELLRQTRLDALPVVDGGGRLVGLCKQESCGAPRQGDAAQVVSAVMVANVQRFRPSENVARLIDFFNQDPLAWAVVVEQERPVGLLNCDSLVALSQSAGATNVTAEASYDKSTAYLLVPDLGLEEIGQEA